MAPPFKTTLTVREQAAIRLLVLSGGKESPQQLYRIAHPGSLEQVEALSDLPSTASRWLHSARLEKFRAEQEAIFKAQRDAERKRIEDETLHRIQATSEKAIDKSGFVDYSNPANQLALLNRLLNTSQDQGEILDALKVVITRQADLNPDARPETKQVRAYVPMSCASCPLYAEAKGKIGKQ